MRILFVNAYFMPENIAFSHLEKDLIEGLIDAGHEIDVICPIPTRGISDDAYESYRTIKNEELYDGRVRVRRFFAPREAKNPLLRAFRYLWCNVREYFIGKKYKNIDAVFAVSTPPTQGLLAGMLSKKLKCPFIYSLQDIFPDSLVTTGLSEKKSLAWKLGTWLERKTYEYAKSIIVITESCRKNLLDKKVPEGKVALIANWVDIEQVKPIKKKENKLISELKIDDNKFFVVYAGNFGEAQGADIVLKAAEKLLAETEIQFIIFGGGTQFENAVQYVSDCNLTNVIIKKLLPQERVSEVYSLGDIALITCKKGVGNSGMPSKTWNIMACNTPIVASFDENSDMVNIIKNASAGVCVEPENEEMLAEAIKSAYYNRLISHGRDYVVNNVSKKICVDKYLKLFEALKGDSVS